MIENLTARNSTVVHSADRHFTNTPVCNSGAGGGIKRPTKFYATDAPVTCVRCKARRATEAQHAAVTAEARALVAEIKAKTNGRQFCAGCLRTVTDYATFNPREGVSFHYCRECIAGAEVEAHAENATRGAVTCMWDDSPAVTVSAGDYGQPVGPKCARHSAPTMAERMTAHAARAERMPIGPRGQVFGTKADRPGNGSTRSWRRQINGQWYGFALINMPSGEVRYSVQRYNGYGDHLVKLGTTQAEADQSGMRWACAWNRSHWIVVKATEPVGKRMARQHPPMPGNGRHDSPVGGAALAFRDADAILADLKAEAARVDAEIKAEAWEAAQAEAERRTYGAYAGISVEDARTLAEAENATDAHCAARHGVRHGADQRGVSYTYAAQVARVVRELADKKGITQGQALNLHGRQYGMTSGEIESVRDELTRAIAREDVVTALAPVAPGGRYRIVAVSTNGGTSSANSRYATIDEAKRSGERTAKGITSYYQIRVIDASTSDAVSIGHRSGPNGTGERWTWREA